MKHVAFFGDGKHPFALTDTLIAELERKANLGIGALYLRCVQMAFQLSDLTEIIRLGLIGGGASPERAAQLTDTYAKDRPIEELYPLAVDILQARWSGAAHTEEAPND